MQQQYLELLKIYISNNIMHFDHKNKTFPRGKVRQFI